MFLLLFQRETSELPRPVAVKLCHIIGSWFSKFRGPLSPSPPQTKRKLDQKRVNSRRFRTTSNFDQEYIRNGSRYRKFDRLELSTGVWLIPWGRTANTTGTRNWRRLIIRNLERSRRWAPPVIARTWDIVCDDRSLCHSATRRLGSRRGFHSRSSDSRRTRTRHPPTQCRNLHTKRQNWT